MLDAPMLARCCTTFGVTPPAAVAEANALAAATETMLAAVQAETAPDLATITVANVRKVYEAHVTFGNHAERLKTAEAFHALATPRVEQAWRSQLGALCAAFAEPFAEQVDAFQMAYSEISPFADDKGHVDPHRVITAGLDEPYRNYSAAVTKLELLGHLRWMFSTELPIDLGISGGSDNGYPTLSQVALIDSKQTAGRLPAILAGTPRYADEWWVRLSRAAGVTLKWQTRQQQIPWRSLPTASTGPATP